MESIDVPRSMYLSELALDFALQSLRTGGGFLIKIFQGQGFDEFLADVKKNFKSVTICKPKASRDRSREVYILGREICAQKNFLGENQQARCLFSAITRSCFMNRIMNGSCKVIIRYLNAGSLLHHWIRYD